MNSPFRKEQYLPHLKTSTFPKRWLFFDTETHMVEASRDGSDMDFKLGHAIYVEFDKKANIKTRKDFSLTHKDEFYKVLLSLDRKKKRLMVVAHNIKFDLEVTDIPFKLWLDGIETEPPIQNGITFIWNVKLHNGSVQFIDTVNFIPTTLENLGNDLGYEKLDVDLNNISYDDLMTYCIRDVEITLEFIQRFIQFSLKNNLGGFRSTLASQAFSTYRYRFMNIQPFVSNYQPALDLARKGYYGGRTEAFFIGKQVNDNFYYADINSCYPTAMMSDNLPIELVMHRKTPASYVFETRMQQNYIIADVTIDTNANAFPMRFNKYLLELNKEQHKKQSDKIRAMGGKLLFPIGHFRTTLHHDELIFALEHDMIIDVHEYSAYKTAPLYQEYVNFFYDLKQKATIEKNKSDRLMTKLYLNSLYGKKGQRYHNTVFIEKFQSTKCYTYSIANIDDMTTEKEIMWFGKLYMDTTTGESTYSIPSIAGAITAKARMLLWSYMVDCGLENVLYCDTDSIITNLSGFIGLSENIHETRLGALGLEDTSKYVEIRNAKDYSFNEKTKIKGIPKNAVQIGENEWEIERFEGFREWRNRGASGSPKLFLTNKKRLNPYNKGKVLPDGKVEPYIMFNNLIVNL